MKRWIALLLSAILVFSLAACTGPSDTEDGGEDTFKIEEKYDENGNILMQPVYMGWNLWYYNTFTYEGNKLISKKYCRNNGDIINEWKYVYAEDGILERVEMFVNNVEPMLLCEEFYDEYGLLVGKYYYDFDGSTTDYYIYKYDSQGRCTTQTYYDDTWVSEEQYGSYTYVNFAYDRDGNCVEKEKYDEFDELLFRWTYSYDDFGNVLKETASQYLDGKEHKTVTDYSYYDNGKVEEIVQVGRGVRTIETWDISGALITKRYYEEQANGAWTMLYALEYSGDTKVLTSCKADGKYIVQTEKGNAEAAETVKTEYYNADATLFCTNSEGVFYDAAGNKMTTAPDVSAWSD